MKRRRKQYSGPLSVLIHVAQSIFFLICRIILLWRTCFCYFTSVCAFISFLNKIPRPWKCQAQTLYHDDPRTPGIQLGIKINIWIKPVGLGREYQLVKLQVVMPDNQSWVPGTHIVGGEDHLSQSVLWSPHTHHGPCPFPNKQTKMINKYSIKKKLVDRGILEAPPTTGSPSHFRLQPSKPSKSEALDIWMQENVGAI